MADLRDSFERWLPRARTEVEQYRPEARLEQIGQAEGLVRVELRHELQIETIDQPLSHGSGLDQPQVNFGIAVLHRRLLPGLLARALADRHERHRLVGRRAAAEIGRGESEAAEEADEHEQAVAPEHATEAVSLGAPLAQRLTDDGIITQTRHCPDLRRHLARPARVRSQGYPCGGATQAQERDAPGTSTTEFAAAAL